MYIKKGSIMLQQHIKLPLSLTKYRGSIMLQQHIKLPLSITKYRGSIMLQQHIKLPLSITKYRGSIMLQQHIKLPLSLTKYRGGSRRAHPAPPLELEKIWFLGVKSWFFTRNTQNIFAPPSAIGKNKKNWRKIVIFHMKYPKHFRASLRSAQFF